MYNDHSTDLKQITFGCKVDTWKEDHKENTTDSGKGFYSQLRPWPFHIETWFKVSIYSLPSGSSILK